ncbi:MAG: ABC transporter permease, partial [bacterium]|nr:ABC transporter permease [bacterium]
TTAYGQVQAAQFTVVTLLKATNPFMSVASFTSLETMKPLIGLEPQESQSLSVIMNELNDPKIVIEQAQRLHEALQPGVAGFMGTLQTAGGNTQNVQALAVHPELSVHQAFEGSMQVVGGQVSGFWDNRELAMLSRSMAQSLGVQPGDPISLTYETKFQGMFGPRSFRVAAIFESNDLFEENMVFLHEQEFYESCFPAVPKFPATLAEESLLFPLLLKEWTLLEMTGDADSYEKKHKALNNSDWKGRVVEVNTMYELASDVLKMEQVLDMVTMIAVMVLFFIILIGVVNTLRMTIRERTREIGTVRAIGMQRSDVRWSFVLEVVLLAFFSSLVGLGVGFLAMKLLSIPTIESDSMLTMFLLDKHVHFLPTVMDVVKNLGIILIIAFGTAFFPARRAAKMSVAGALRHFE